MVFESLIKGLDYILDPVLRPLLTLGNFWTLIILAVVLAVLMTLIHKFATNQARMKEMKTKMKDFQKQMKEEKDNTDKVMALQKEVMVINMEYMKQSLKPTLFTFLPVILIFGWLAANLAFLPIQPGSEFTTTVVFEDGISGTVSIVAPEGVQILSQNPVEIEDEKAIFSLKGIEGSYIIRFKHNEKLYSKDLLITKEQRYEEPVQAVEKSDVTELRIDNTPLKFNFGLFNLSWFWTYVIIQVISSLLLRKVFKIH